VEEDYIRYLHFLKTEKRFKASSLWSVYSRLNNCHQRKFGTKLQKWPRLTNQGRDKSNYSKIILILFLNYCAAAD
jgi:hypothetical protein